MVTLICALVESLPIGTNLGMLHLLWMLVSGQVLAARGAVIPGLSACGLSERAVRRAWAALGQGDRAISPLLARWQWQVLAEGQWQPQTQGGDHPVAVDMTAFWRPRLQNCPTTHDHALGGQGAAGHPRRSDRAGGSGGQPASGLAAGFRACGHSGPQRQRAHPRGGCASLWRSARPLTRWCLIPASVWRCCPEEGATRYVVRLAKNSTVRRATPPASQGRGRPPTRGALVRPLTRSYTKGGPSRPPLCWLVRSSVLESYGQGRGQDPWTQGL